MTEARITSLVPVYRCSVSAKDYHRKRVPAAELLWNVHAKAYRKIVKALKSMLR